MCIGWIGTPCSSCMHIDPDVCNTLRTSSFSLLFNEMRMNKIEMEPNKEDKWLRQEKRVLFHQRSLVHSHFDDWQVSPQQHSLFESQLIVFWYLLTFKSFLLFLFNQLHFIWTLFTASFWSGFVNSVSVAISFSKIAHIIHFLFAVFIFITMISVKDCWFIAY